MGQSRHTAPETADPKSLGVLPGENALEGYWRRANVRVKALVEVRALSSNRRLGLSGLAHVGTEPAGNGLTRAPT